MNLIDATIVEILGHTLTEIKNPNSKYRWQIDLKVNGYGRVSVTTRFYESIDAINQIRIGDTVQI